jgi:hypothetical protein
MIEIESGDVLEMQDEKFADLLAEMNAKQAKASKAKTLGWLTFGIGVMAVFVDAQVGLGILVATAPAWLIGKWLDSYQKRSVLFYHLEPEVSAAYERMTQAFDKLAGCVGKWHVEAGGAVQDLTTWKRNAGASHIVQKKPTTLAYGLPAVLVSNVNPPVAHVGKQTIHFLPDVALIVDKNRIGAVSYGNLRLRWQNSNFIEEGAVPSDTEVISHTWKHPNKSGGPDRRFANNHQIPICRYEVLHLSSDSGVNEMLEFSRTGFCAGFGSAIDLLNQAICHPTQRAIIGANP